MTEIYTYRCDICGKTAISFGQTTGANVALADSIGSMQKNLPLKTHGLKQKKKIN